MDIKTVLSADPPLRREVRHCTWYHVAYFFSVQLQRVAKLAGIKANAKSVVIAAQLRVLMNDEIGKEKTQHANQPSPRIVNASPIKEEQSSICKSKEQTNDGECALICTSGAKAGENLMAAGSNAKVDAANVQIKAEPVPMDIDAEAPAMDSKARKAAVLAARNERSLRKAAEFRHGKSLAATSIAHRRAGPKSIDRPTAHRALAERN